MKFLFDMDGVLVRYVRADYIGDTPEFMKKGQHYFLNLDADEKMVSVINSLHTRGIDVGVLSKVSNHGDIVMEQIKDKEEWLKKHLSLPLDRCHITYESKVDYAKRQFGNDLSQIYLIDDYNKNLDEWARAGGRAIKYLNSENSFSPRYLNLTETMTDKDIIELLTFLKGEK